MCSNYAIGGYLYQKSEKEERNVIAYTSTTLKGGQLGYTTTEKECIMYGFSALPEAVAYYFIGTRINCSDGSQITLLPFVM